MQIISYEYKDVDGQGWHFEKIDLKKVNLFVGDTGTGKTKILHTIFDLGVFAVSNRNETILGSWEITFIQDEKTYKWQLEVIHKHDKRVISKDNIWVLENEIEVPLITRSENEFIFNGNKVPKLSLNQSSTVLLQEENLIKPIFKGFSSIMRRLFSQDELLKISTYQPIPHEIVNMIGKDRNSELFYKADFNLNLRLYILNLYFPETYDKIINYYRSTFPFLTEIDILDLGEIHKRFGTGGQIPVFCVKEKEVKKWIELGEFSSGMQKVLLILTDIFTLPKGSVYLIDEYENSLGIGAINFFPTIIFDRENEVQLIITSHHPYLISNIPIKNWFVFHRRGSHVMIKFGEELEHRYGNSKQEAFIKLINDPFYTEGIE